MADFSRHVAAQLPDADAKALQANPYRDWASALEHLAAHAEQHPLLVVLGEYPELLTHTPELSAVIRAFLDRQGGSSALRLVLCRSAVRTMQEIQHYKAPLYGRFDLTIGGLWQVNCKQN